MNTRGDTGDKEEGYLELKTHSSTENYIDTGTKRTVGIRYWW